MMQWKRVIQELFARFCKSVVEEAPSYQRLHNQFCWPLRNCCPRTAGCVSPCRIRNLHRFRRRTCVVCVTMLQFKFWQNVSQQKNTRQAPSRSEAGEAEPRTKSTKPPAKRKRSGPYCLRRSWSVRLRGHRIHLQTASDWVTCMDCFAFWPKEIA